MTKEAIGYIVAGGFAIAEVLIISLGYEVFGWPPSILIPAMGIFTFFGVIIIVNLFSQSSDLKKGEVRTAIAASLLVVYFFLISVTSFTSTPWKESKKTNTPDVGTSDVQAKAPEQIKDVSVETPDTDESSDTQSMQSQAESPTVNEILKDLLDDFTELIMIVVGFYFGGRSAEEIVKTLKKQ